MDKPLNLRHQVILGLSFLLKDNGQITFNKDFFTLSRHCMISPLQKKSRIISPEELDKQIEYSRNQAISKKDRECEKEGQCSLANILIQEDFEEEEYEDMYLTELVHINNSINYFMINIKEEQIQSLIDRLEKLEIIGENVLRYWEKDKVEGILKIKNPYYKIKTTKIEATEKDREDYKTHINDLLKLGVIRRSESLHRSAAFLVNKHSEQKRGKGRMVINYKRLNDNTEDDGYDIPTKEYLLGKIKDCTIFSKFDCKSGFWQIKMHPDNIPWTAFSCPEGHFEWLVMPFGLKNAPSIFQRKMDNIFRDNDSFVAVYIDDILVFSKSKKQHIGHLQIVLKKFEEHGIIISKSKMQLFQQTIEFVGVIIGDGKILLQPHISEKILTFPDKIEETKELQKFLRLLNYARPFIKNLSRISGPLFSKVGSKGQKYFNQEDIKLVKSLKEIVTKLPPLDLPLINDYLIIETDGCSLGWGAVLLAKPHKYSAKNTEKICRYSSGKYKEKGNISSIDAEVLAIIYAIDSFRILIISKK